MIYGVYFDVWGSTSWEVRVDHNAPWWAIQIGQLERQVHGEHLRWEREREKQRALAEKYGM